MFPSSQKAQVVLEYLALAALVMLAIFVMGPYTIRSINAFFRFTEDTMKDSVAERFVQEKSAPVNVIPAGCYCGGWVPRGCGEGGCYPNERLSTRDCTAHCNDEKKCEIEEPDALGNGGCCEVIGEACWELGGAPICTNNSDRVFKKRCGSNSTWTFYCAIDPLCTPHCIPSNPPNAIFCFNTLSETQPSPYPSTRVIASGDACPVVGNPSCVAKCIAPAVPNATFTQCN